MVNLSRLSALFTFDLTPLTYNPAPGSNLPSGSKVDLESLQPHGLRGRAANSDCKVEPYNPPPVTDQTFPSSNPTNANIYRYRQQQSVNLGSWFIHEKWMTPSVFKCASGSQQAEIDIAYGYGSVESARAVLERHWDTFIDESDFQYLASIGINTVRLPIGYWNLGPDFMAATPFESVAQVYQNCWSRVIRAINQAGKVGIGVLVDLHGAVGSQNGQQHSGVSDGATNLFNVPSNMDQTIKVLIFLAEQLAGVDNVVGIQILNEPQNVDALPQFYTRAIEAMRQVSPAAKAMPLYLHDGFDLDRFSDYVSGRTDFVVQDHHSYFVFTPSDEKESGSQHTSDVKGAIAESLNRVSAKQHHNLVIHEWSCALTAESLQNDDDAEQARKEFCTSQMEVYAKAAAGWGFWSYKKESCEDDPGWCFKTAVGRSLPSTFSSSSDKSHKRAPKARSSFEASLERRFSGSGKNPASIEGVHQQRDDSKAQDPAASQSNARGYSDGYNTAKIFWAFNRSTLGFDGQFMMDAIAKAGPSLIAPGTETDYSDGFMKGLAAGESEAALHGN